jgi:transposase
MPAPVPLPIRQAMWRRWVQGATTTELSQAFDVPPRTVRNLLRRWQQRGEQGLAPDYRRPDPPPPRPGFDLAVQLRRDHPRWGAGLIRIYLLLHGIQPLPAERTLLRWFHRAGLAPAPPGRRPASSKPRAMAPHEIWEVDAAEEIPLGDGTRASWLRIADEFSGAVLHTETFPLGRWNSVPARATQEQLRHAFADWGLPRCVRVDNGWPWGSAGDLPTDLALWLIGLGIEVHWNPPCCPQANGVVEHSQGTGKRWAEPETCRDLGELQGRLQEQDYIQRALYPSIHGRSRTEAFPGLKHSGRVYRPEEEASRWELERVLGALADCLVVRRVDSSGTISLYNRNRYVSKRLKSQDIYVSLDPIEVEWLCSSRDGVCYHRLRADELTADRIRGLNVSHHRDRSGAARQNRVSGFPAKLHVG